MSTINDKLLKFVKEIQDSNRQNLPNEEATKHSLILPILNMLGWNVFDNKEVKPEYDVDNRKNRVDYALTSGHFMKVFIEVKRHGSDLDNHKQQLLEYAFQEGVKLAVLTDGVSWWFFLSLHEGSWDQRKFYSIELNYQTPEDIARNFEKFLSKEKVATGEAIEEAEKIYKSRQKNDIIRHTLPKAWYSILAETDELLVELIADSTERMCGYRPNNNTVAEFITNEILKGNTKNTSKDKLRIKTTVKSEAIRKTIHTRNHSNFTKKRVKGFILSGKSVDTKNWRELILKLGALLYKERPNEFDKVLNIRGRKRPYFSTNPHELRTPKLITGTGIYIEGNNNANTIYKLSQEMVSTLGYKTKEFKIQLDE